MVQTKEDRVSMWIHESIVSGSVLTIHYLMVFYNLQSKWIFVNFYLPTPYVAHFPMPGIDLCDYPMREWTSRMHLKYQKCWETEFHIKQSMKKLLNCSWDEEMLNSSIRVKKWLNQTLVNPAGLVWWVVARLHSVELAGGCDHVRV